MKVIVDDKIPYIREPLEKIADEVVCLPGNSFTPAIVRDADALIIRTRTHCDRNLLNGSKVKFIATATIGFDHIDVDYCREAGIVWKNAPGCNASSVVQYVQSVLLIFKLLKGKDLNHLTLGVVGVGNVGSKVVKMAQEWGMRVLQNDPPRECSERDGKGGNYFVSLKQLMEECDVISFHVPLNRDGIYKTFHLGDEDFFSSLKKNPFIINTSRGEVIETKALLSAIDNKQISDAVIDVWENEPKIDRDLLNKVLIGTPHIAGYSADGKANATRMSLCSFCDFFGLSHGYNILPTAPLSDIIKASSKEEALLKIYDPCRDSDWLKQQPDKFEYFRGNYPLRREADAYQIDVV
jgi:erythronate-4-phosphate dehydrogenase